MGRAAFGPTIAGVGHCWDWELLGGGFAPHDEHLLLMMSFSDIRPGCKKCSFGSGVGSAPSGAEFGGLVHGWDWGLLR